MRCEGKIKVNLGCGSNTPLDWVNIDNSFTLRLSRCKMLYVLLCKIFKIKTINWPKNIMIADIRNRLRFPDNSIEAIYGSHVLEHMNYEDADCLLEECYRCLTSKGIIRLIVPDLYQISKKYIEQINGEPKEEASQNFLREMCILEPPYSGILRIISSLFGYSRHVYFYDEWSLKELLEKHNFRNVRKMEFEYSNISNIKAVEKKERFNMAICLEAIKS